MQYHSLSFALFNQLGYEHPFIYVWYEYNTDIHSSVYLAYGGYYRQAIGLLRPWIELVLAGLFFEKQPKEEFQYWLEGKNRTPSIQTSIKKIWSTNKPNWLVSLEQLADELDKYIHSRGIEKVKLQAGRDNVPRYIPHAYDIWYQLFKRCFASYTEILVNTHPNELINYFEPAKNETRTLYSSIPDDLQYIIEPIILLRDDL